MILHISIDPSVSPKINQTTNQVEFFYPCKSSDTCFPYEVQLSKGNYLVECYGASSGIPSGFSTTTSRRIENESSCIPQLLVAAFRGNTNCNPLNSPGSGGYIAGTLSLKEKTTLYVHVGGSGSFSTKKGGYNGGADGGGCSGGGASDVRVISDDISHRIIVAGGGGGSDDIFHSTTWNEGAGGAGGYPEGQGYWIDGVYNPKVASQTNGYKFGEGEAPYVTGDTAGGGGGWFGGYCSNHQNGGAGGGSSFILAKDAIIPDNVGYAFDQNSPYTMKLFGHESGIWSGNGKIIITQLIIYKSLIRCFNMRIPFSYYLIFLSKN